MPRGRADTVWEDICAFLDVDRHWASFLPEEVQRKLLREDAVALLHRVGTEERASTDEQAHGLTRNR